MYFMDEWPMASNGEEYNGKGLLAHLQDNKSPFAAVFDVNMLVQEIEQRLGNQVVDIVLVSKGSNNYGFHLRLATGQDIVARLARGDVNMPDWDGFSLEWQASDAEFEAAIYNIFAEDHGVPVSRLLFHRLPHQTTEPRGAIPSNILGRRLSVFSPCKGHDNVWNDLSNDHKTDVLQQAATIRAALFGHQLPLSFAKRWLRERLFEQKPKSFSTPIGPTREFCKSLLLSKVEATIGRPGDMIGWESDNEVAGPVAAAAKRSLINLIPHLLPIVEHDETVYRLVLEHDDFGVHNMTIDMETGQPIITSVFDWDTGYVVPALLSNPEMAVAVDLIADRDAKPAFVRVPQDVSEKDMEQYSSWTNQYFNVLFDKAPDYKRAIEAGRDARHLWFALKAWRGQDPEGYFGRLGCWAEERMKRPCA